MESDIIGYKMRDGSSISFMDKKWFLFITDKESSLYGEYVASFYTFVEALEAWRSRVDGDELQRKQIELEKAIKDEFRVHSRVKQLEDEIEKMKSNKDIEESKIKE